MREDVTLLQGDCRDILPTLPEKSVHATITSPPYFGLRDYQTGTWEGGDPACEHQGKERYYTMRAAASSSSEAFSEAGPENSERFKKARWREKGDCACGARRVDRQIGLEESLEAHIAALVGVFREVWRVLRDDGTLWLNYGDAYAANRGSQVPDSKHVDVGNGRGSRVPCGFKPKDLLLMPFRIAMALQAEGWYLRSAITLCKNNPMPESVTDRPTSATEMLFLLTKKPTYYYDQEAIREPHSPESLARQKRGRSEQHKWTDGPGGQTIATDMADCCHPNGRNKRNFWMLSSQPLKSEHFAAFPEKLVEPCILAGCPAEVCSVCGSPWTRVVEKTVHASGAVFNGKSRATLQGGDKPRASLSIETTGWQPSCAHNAPTIPGVVLDCFAGSGTVSRVATRLGRRSIAIELKPEYCEIIERRNAQLGLLL